LSWRSPASHSRRRGWFPTKTEPLLLGISELRPADPEGPGHVLLSVIATAPDVSNEPDYRRRDEATLEVGGRGDGLQLRGAFIEQTAECELD
jgi:hypothetical protein